MPSTLEWTREAYEASLSSRCWWFTPYDEGWLGTGRPDSSPFGDGELRQIVAMEQALQPLPTWVKLVVLGPIRHIGPCGHCAFPRSYLDAVDAIGRQQPPRLNHTCFTIDRSRKERLAAYALCLDAWLAGAEASGPAAELAERGPKGLDWRRVCVDLWAVLGERSELKGLLIERLLHRTRWWLKATRWDDDDGTAWCPDAYLGEWDPADDLLVGNGNPHLARGGLRERSSPGVQRLESRLAEICPDWHWFRTVIVDFSWPCAPKAFRFLEKALWCIGCERPVISLPSFPLADPEPVPGFLQCDDTWPDPDVAGAWWELFVAALRDWWQDSPPEGVVAEDVYQRLGEPTPVKRWLVRLFARRCELAAEFMAGLLCAKPGARRGTGRLATQ